jgi:hypothetical protein
MAVTHYDVLGVRPDAPPEDVRRAYLNRARELHPDRTASKSKDEADRSARQMQQVNEAWRILRDPNTRSAYDRALLSREVARPAPPPRATEPAIDDDDLDRPFDAPLAQPGDVVVSIARAIPWVAVLVILVVIFVFTAYAGKRGTDDTNSLLNHCVVSGSASAVRAVPCEGPNEGKVVQIVDRASLCQSGATTRSIEGNQWLCLMPVDRAPSGTGQG